MKQCSIGIFGAGGFAREVMSFAQRSPSAREIMKHAKINWFFVDLCNKAKINGIPVISESEFLSQDGKLYFNVAIADSNVRERIVSRITQKAMPISIVADEALVMPPSIAREGLVMSPFSTLSVDTRIGCWCHINFNCYIAHDCVIGDFVTFAPHVCCNGNVHLGDHVYIGASAVIRNGTPSRPLTIGKSAFIGMGAVVTRSVPEGVTVVGVPAAPFKSR